MKLSGWLEFKRGNKFFTLRDATGNCQVLCELDAVQLPAKESVVSIEGIVRPRPDKDINPKMLTGDVEVNCTEFQVLNRCKPLPIVLNDFSKSKEELRMRYRYVDIRSKMMQQNLRLRSRFILKLRKYLCEQHNFVDVETPTLFRKTPGGAQEFVVPTQKPGMFYSLPQSPQQFKQLLMVGGIDRYMQIARCYRDEGAKPDRQPEFTQLDLELSFTSQNEIKVLIEHMIADCWPEELSSLILPFPRMTYADAISTYGVDKPDTRFTSTIVDISKQLSSVSVFQSSAKDVPVIVKAINIKGGCSKLKASQIKSIQQSVQMQHSIDVAVVKVDENDVWNSPLAKYLHTDDLAQNVNKQMGASQGDLLFICAHDSWQHACEALGTCRRLASLRCSDNGQPLHSDKSFHFLWIEDFPLFELENACLQTTHHPFTAPLDDDLPLLYTDPIKVRGQHYDLVLNGCEVGGGSMRVHDADIQRYILATLLKEDTDQLEHLLRALDSGCPPHGGIALGLDRLISIMCDAPSIRDVIAFPKSSEGTDLMTKAPCQLEQKDLTNYHISVNTGD